MASPVTPNSGRPAGRPGSPPSDPDPDRRGERRGRFNAGRHLLFASLRATRRLASDFKLAVGIFLIAGVLVALAGTWGFVEVASHVQRGSTQPFDDAVMQFMATHRVGWIERSLLEITALGTGLVVFMVVGVSAIFLTLTKHKYSAALLLVATFGGVLFNGVLKLFFDRPRPRIFPWITPVVSSSFPSGHAMSAAIVYSTVAYLAARLMVHRWARWLMMLFAFVIIVLIGASRIYLGVHYPSDVLGGFVIGFAWAGFCMASLEAIQIYARRNEPQELRHEEPPPPKDVEEGEAVQIEGGAAPTA